MVGGECTSRCDCWRGLQRGLSHLRTGVKFCCCHHSPNDVKDHNKSIIFLAFSNYFCHLRLVSPRVLLKVLYCFCLNVNKGMITSAICKTECCSMFLQMHIYSRSLTKRTWLLKMQQLNTNLTRRRGIS